MHLVFHQKQLISTVHVYLLSREIWAEQFLVYLQCLIERISRIVKAVIAAKGGDFGESKVFFYLICT